jgi:hypothetical protein
LLRCLQLFDNEALEHFARQGVLGWHGTVLAGQLLAHALHPRSQFVGNRLGIDHGDDEIGRLRLR